VKQPPQPRSKSSAQRRRSTPRPDEVVVIDDPNVSPAAVRVGLELLRGIAAGELVIVEVGAAGADQVAA
jgi:hypothetical protein